jgi:small multidrug resistance pump
MTWQLLTAISVLSLSSSVLLQRVLLHKDKLNPYTYAVVFQAIVGVLLTIFALIYGFKLPNIQALVWPALLSVVAFGLGHIIYAKTLQLVEASAFSVLFATQAIWIMLLGIMLFHETLSILQIAGIILIFGSIGLLTKDIRKLSISKGTALGLLTGLLFGIAITSWSYVGRHTDGLSWAAISFIGTSFVAYLARPQSISKMKTVVTGQLLPKLVLLGTLYAIGSLAMLFAYKEGAFSIVTPLRQTSIVVTVLLALIFLSKERNRIKAKLTAALICFLGVLLIVA